MTVYRYVRLAASVTLCAAVMLVQAGAAPNRGGPGFSATPVDETADPAASYQAGIEALQNEDFEAAEAHFDLTLQATPAHPEANYHMGLAKLGQGEPEEAVDFLERATREQPNFIEAREQLALVRFTLGDREEAERQLAALRERRTACELDDCGGDYGARLAQAIERVEAALAPPVDEDEDARLGAPWPQNASLLLRREERGAIRYRQAARFLNEGRYEAAIASLEASQRFTGPHPDILNYLGFAHRKIGALEKAEAYYLKALALDPDHLGANEYLGELYAGIGALDAAKVRLARLDRLCPFGCAEREDLARHIAESEARRFARR